MNALISIREIQNGFVVGDHRAQRNLIGASGSEDSGERFFATFDEMTAALPDVIRSAFAAADAERAQRERMIAQRMSNAGADVQACESSGQYVGY